MQGKANSKEETNKILILFITYSRFLNGGWSLELLSRVGGSSLLLSCGESLCYGSSESFFGFLLRIGLV